MVGATRIEHAHQILKAGDKFELIRSLFINLFAICIYNYIDT
jgi:hypothetical protein